MTLRQKMAQSHLARDSLEALLHMHQSQMALLMQTKVEMRMIPWWAVHVVHLHAVHHVVSHYRLAIQRALLVATHLAWYLACSTLQNAKNAATTVCSQDPNVHTVHTYSCLQAPFLLMCLSNDR